MAYAIDPERGEPRLKMTCVMHQQIAPHGIPGLGRGAQDYALERKLMGDEVVEAADIDIPRHDREVAFVHTVCSQRYLDGADLAFERHRCVDGAVGPVAKLVLGNP